MRRKTDRRSPAPWARHALTLLAVVWLNVAVQPCVMALAPDVGPLNSNLLGTTPDSPAPGKHHCPHCPPVQTRSVSAHSAGPAQHEGAGGGHHGHGGAEEISDTADAQATPVNCVDTGSDCGAFDATAAERQGADFKAKPGAEFSYLLPAWPSVVVRRHNEMPPRWRTLAHLPGPPPALNCLYCVYLK